MWRAALNIAEGISYASQGTVRLASAYYGGNNDGTFGAMEPDGAAAGL